MPLRWPDAGMTASSTRRGGWPAATAGAEFDGMVAILASALGGCAGLAAMACGGVLVIRRLTVAAPAPSGAVLAVAVAGTALVALADAALHAGGLRQAAAAARIGLVLAVAAVALPPRAGTWLDGTATAVAVAIAAGAVAFAPRRSPARAAAGDLAPARRPGNGPPATGRRRPRAAPDRVPGRFRQRFTRYDGRKGGDRLRGRINVEVGAGARLAHGHVGFCPAFAATPAVEVTTDYDGVEATVAAAEVLPWGVRVEVRLAEPAEEPLEIPVDLLVKSLD
jgi:hypothetical protein